MRRLPALVMAAALVTAAAGCGDDGSVLGQNGTTAAPTTQGPPTSQAPQPTEATTTLPPTTVTTAPPATTAPIPPPTTTTTLPPMTTTTLPPTTTTVAPVSYEPPADFFPDPLPGSDQAHGSGCVVPGGSMTLPDGIWFGYVTAFSPGMLTFDLACFWTGQVAEDKAAEDGEEAFDFYIRNMNPTTRQVPLSGSAQVWYVPETVTMPTAIPVTDWPTIYSFLTCPADWCSVWLYINGGVVTHLVEQYLP